MGQVLSLAMLCVGFLLKYTYLRRQS